MAVLALLSRRVFEGEVPDPLIRHLGVHARCLVAIPLFVAAEAAAERVIPSVVRYFVESGVVEGDALPDFADAQRAAAEVRDSTLGLVLLVGLVTLNAARGLLGYANEDEVSWALTHLAGGPYLLAAGWWYLLVVRPFFSFLVGLWLWRLVTLSVLFFRIARLGLKLVPTHPDGAGGLGFLERVPSVFVPVVLALSVVLASLLGHDVLYHGTRVADLRLVVAVYAVAVIVILLSPLLVFSPSLMKLRGEALLQYGSLVGRHGRLVHRRWIRGERIDDEELLTAPEIGPVADTAAMHHAVKSLRPIPFDLRTVATLLAAALIPMVPVAAIEIPMKDILIKLASALL